MNRVFEQVGVILTQDKSIANLKGMTDEQGIDTFVFNNEPYDIRRITCDTFGKVEPYDGYDVVDGEPCVSNKSKALARTIGVDGVIAAINLENNAVLLLTNIEPMEGKIVTVLEGKSLEMQFSLDSDVDDVECGDEDYEDLFIVCDM